jgi:hypothetical protein
VRVAAVNEALLPLRHYPLALFHLLGPLAMGAVIANRLSEERAAVYGVVTDTVVVIIFLIYSPARTCRERLHAVSKPTLPAPYQRHRYGNNGLQTDRRVSRSIRVAFHVWPMAWRKRPNIRSRQAGSSR